MKQLILALLLFISVTAKAQDTVDSAQYYANQFYRYDQLFKMAKDLYSKVHDTTILTVRKRYYDSCMKYTHLLYKNLELNHRSIMTIKKPQ